MKTSAYTESKNDHQYTELEGHISEYLPTLQFGITEGLQPGDHVLDIGCNNARLYNTAKGVHGDIKYTGVDVDGRAIEQARSKYPEAEFICDAYPTPQLDGRQFDAVVSVAVFTMFTNWRESLAMIAQQAKQRIVLDLALTMDFPTVDDPDLSYNYYLDSGERVPFVIQNVMHFVNYCFTEHVNAGNVEIKVSRPTTTSSFFGVPYESLLRGVAVITKDTTGKPIFGSQTKIGNPEFMANINRDDFRLGKASIDIDGEYTQIYPKAVF